MAAALLEAKLSDRGVDAAVRSAGTLEGGRPAWPEAATVMAERGLDLAGHTSRQMEPAIVRDADMVLGMTREHAREAIAMEPSAYLRVFTLKELIRVGETRPRSPGALLDSWLAEVAEQREVKDLLGADPTDDVADPIGGPLGAFRDTATELDSLLDRLVCVAFPG